MTKNGNAATSKENKKAFQYDSQTYKTKVQPYYYSTSKCYMKYSEDQTISSKTKILTLASQKIKEKFNFKFLCDDLKKSTEGAIIKECLDLTLKSLPSYGIEGITSYSVQEKTLDSFVVHKLSPKIGFGVSSLVGIEKGTIIAEYVGERKKQDTFDKLFGDNTYVLLTSIGPDIDAKDYGNIARFFSHCPLKHDNPEVLTANVIPVSCSDKSLGYGKNYLMAVRDIKPFEPICWNYGDKYRYGEIELLNSKTYLPMDGVVSDSAEF